MDLKSPRLSVPLYILTALFTFAIFADALVRWFQQLCLAGALAIAEPKTLRWTLWHTPARIVRKSRQRIVRVLDGWPSEQALLDAYQRVALIT